MLPEGEYGVLNLWKNLKKEHAIEFEFGGSGLGIVQKNN